MLQTPPVLMTTLRESSEARIIELEKELGQTHVKDQNLLAPASTRRTESRIFNALLSL
jgi:hypothetical protein